MRFPAFVGHSVVFLALSWFCLSVSVFLLVAPLGRLCWLHSRLLLFLFFEKSLTECDSVCMLFLISFVNSLFMLYIVF